MPFGQQPGPPASKQQMRELLELVLLAGYDGFRDARGPLGLNQRQAGGKFTHDEASELIERLQAADASGEAPGSPVPLPRLSASERALRAMPSEQLAAELQRRGWIVMEP